jgi:hypothetical protein
MNRTVVAILICLTTARLGRGADPKAVSLCEVIVHPEAHMGERVVVYGMVVQYEHGRYLVAVPPCDQDHSGILVQGTDSGSYFAAGGGKGKGVMAIVEGKFVMSSEGVPKFVKTPFLAFSAKKVRYERPQNKR